MLIGFLNTNIKSITYIINTLFNVILYYMSLHFAQATVPKIEFYLLETDFHIYFKHNIIVVTIRNFKHRLLIRVVLYHIAKLQFFHLKNICKFTRGKIVFSISLLVCVIANRFSYFNSGVNYKMINF